ncbi:hypothetical protein [Stutzerimonas stutzeri]|uniref:hypothetical protein n=1 Tax=Stutzerimonas stutzeri TaxID=316 RepID=UPI00210AD5E9|nr:hypothetical protein [Stutzerimonas stutzeri]MCQ4320856.1 hypothetical protein [Stutzerimonas stutzeri]
MSTASSSRPAWAFCHWARAPAEILARGLQGDAGLVQLRLVGRVPLDQLLHALIVDLRQPEPGLGRGQRGLGDLDGALGLVIDHLQPGGGLVMAGGVRGELGVEFLHLQATLAAVERDDSPGPGGGIALDDLHAGHPAGYAAAHHHHVRGDPRIDDIDMGELIEEPGAAAGEQRQAEDEPRQQSSALPPVHTRPVGR